MEVEEKQVKTTSKRGWNGHLLLWKGPLWWQRCCNDYELVSIVDVALRVADVITGSHGTRNELAFDGITKSILDEAIKKKTTTV